MFIDCTPPPAIVQPALVIDEYKTWDPDAPLTIAFMGGSAATHERIRQIEAGPDGWSTAIGLTIVFVEKPEEATIRVAFERDRSWAAIGQDAWAYPATMPTMNLGWADVANDAALRNLWLHELGHALGFRHEPPDGDGESIMLPQTGPSRLSPQDRQEAAAVYGPPHLEHQYLPLVQARD